MRAKWEKFYERDEREAEEGVEIDIIGDGTLIKEVLAPSPRSCRGMRPRLGDRVTIQYTAMLSNGEEFFTTRDFESPFTFRVGHGETIQGIDDAVMDMSKGEYSVFTIAPKLAYGEEGLEGKVPPNETLTYEIELVDYRDMDPEVDEFDEDFKIPDDLDKHGKNDLGPGGEDPNGKYRWERHGQEMIVIAPIGDGTTRKDIEYEVKKQWVKVVVAGDVLLDGEPGCDIDEDESDWEIKVDSDGRRSLFLHLKKDHEFKLWPPTLLKEQVSK